MDDTYCFPCQRDFPRHSSLRQHWDNANFHANDCFRCRAEFYSRAELEQHHRDSFNHHVCPRCDLDYDRNRNLVTHMVQEHNYCTHPGCGRFFCAPSNLQSHKQVHLPKSMKCLVCEKHFATLSAITLHLETGTCSSGITKKWLNRFVMSRDRGNVITIPGRMIGNGSGYDNEETYATEQAWNGSGYQCYLCSKTFRALSSLNRHLKSGYHEQEIYRCLKRSCGFEHRNLSALIQHIESESCGAVFDRCFNTFFPTNNSLMIEA